MTATMTANQVNKKIIAFHGFFLILGLDIIKNPWYAELSFAKTQTEKHKTQNKTLTLKENTK